MFKRAEPALFTIVLAGYVALTTAYSFSIKRKMIIDVIVLAMLYTIRVIAGAAAADIPLSEWLLAFSMFLFLSLALVKRYVEVRSYVGTEKSGPSNRNYRVDDLGIVMCLAAASGFNAVTVFAFYISSLHVHAIYAHPDRLWLACPVLLYWLCRAMILAGRGLINDDPVVFAIKDRNSLIAATIFLVVVAFAAA